MWVVEIARESALFGVIGSVGASTTIFIFQVLRRLL